VLGCLTGLSSGGRHRNYPDMPSHWLQFGLLLPFTMGFALLVAGWVTWNPNKVGPILGLSEGVPVSLRGLRAMIRIVSVISCCAGIGLLTYALGWNPNFAL
jgi:hypothetical protein